MLQSLIETCLREVGFSDFDAGHGVRYWHHRDGGTLSFADAITWWIGTETRAARSHDDLPLMRSLRFQRSDYEAAHTSTAHP